MGRAAKKPAGPWAKTLSAEVRAILARRKISQAQLAEAAGMSKTYLGDRLRDDVALDLNDIAAIATALGMTPLALMELAEHSKNAPGDGPLITGTGSYVGEQSADDDELVRRAARTRRSTGST